GNGMFTAGTTAGTFANTVRATSGGISGSATVTVNPAPQVLTTITVVPDPATMGAGQTQQFTAVGRDAFGVVMDITPVWAVTNGGGTINAGSGLFTAGANGGTFDNTVRASSGGVSGNATVIITAVAPVLASITVTPDPASVERNGVRQFTATGRDADGNVMAITPVWSVTNGGGTINATGRFTAGNATGTFTNTVRATSGGISDRATVIVTAAPPVLATITVTPDPATMGRNEVQQFTAVGRDADGGIMDITPVWSVTNGGGTINANGRFTAGNAVGTFNNTVRATSGGISGNATVIVLAAAPVLATITVTPDPASMGRNDVQQFTAVGRDTNGNIMVITPVWTVTNGGGTINANGRFTAGNQTGTFNNTVRARSGDVSGNATVIVTGAPPPPPGGIDLGAAAPNGIMAGTAVTCVNLGVINADVSISPGNTITGFGPCVITGVQNLANAIAAQAQIDLTNAFNELAGMACPPANAISANLGGTTLEAGVYCTATGIGVTGTLTLDGGGDPNAMFVFQAGTSLTTAGNVVLINGAQAKNVYWLVGSSATIGTASQWQGNIIALTSITLVDNATLTGRALARNGAVSLGTGNVINLP
ncbi:MAG TPA: ice-binding family protein, partial [Longimicrobiales bacterium]|nr:ice-binding family protein [Longimicrobiales bacterium]